MTSDPDGVKASSINKHRVDNATLFDAMGMRGPSNPFMTTKIVNMCGGQKKKDANEGERLRLGFALG